MSTAVSLSSRGRAWAYTGAFLGGGISIAANVAHSFVPPADAAADWQPKAGAVIGSMFWPILLFVAVEILARVVWPQGFWFGLLRFGGLLPVAIVAGLVSYRHLSGLLLFYGEDSTVSVLGPLAVDGLMVMATAALLVTARKPAEPAEPNPAPSMATAAALNTTSGAATPAAPAANMSNAVVPAHLVTNARFAVENHHQSTGQPITADELAARMNLHPDIARQLLASVGQPAAPVLNGTIALAGERR